MRNSIVYLLSIVFLISCKTTHQSFVKFDSDQINYEGRIGVNAANTASEIYWVGSSIEINFEGTLVKAIIADENGTNYFNVIIDGILFKILKLEKGKQTYVLAENLSEEKHTLQLIKRNDWDFGTSLFYGFEIKGKVLDVHKNKPYFFEFYGDSITSGHGNEDNSGNDSSSGDVSNNYNSYAAITARHFNAAYTCISRSGIGIMVSWYNLIMPEMFDRLNPNDVNSKWDFSVKQPDVVVVNLLQNDFWIVNLPEHEEFKRRFGNEKPTKEQVINAYAKFIQKIREVYPKSAIICMLGNMDITSENSAWKSYVEEAVNNLEDTNVYTCFVPYKNTPGHPKVAEQHLMANKLIQKISKEHILKK